MLPAAFGESNTKKRISHILSFRKPSVWLCAAALLLVVGAGAVLFTSPSAKEGEAQEEEGGMTAGPLEGEALAVGLSDKRNPYIGDHIRDAALFGMLPVPETLEYRKMELQTTQEPYELIMVYGLRENADMPRKEWSFSNAVQLFASIENAGRISYAVEKGAEEYRVTYDSSDAEAIFGPLYAYSADKDKMMELQRQISAYMENGNPSDMGEERVYTLNSEGNRIPGQAEPDTEPEKTGGESEQGTEYGETGEESEPEQTDNLPVHMELDKEVYSVKEPVLIMTIENLSDQNLTFGDPYDLLREEGGEYRLVPMKENTGWHDVLNVILPGGKTEQKMDLSVIYEGLDPENYMISKSAALEDEDGEAGDSIVLSIPFVLY